MMLDGATFARQLKKIFALLFFVLISVTPLRAEEWSHAIDLQTGSAYNFPMPLRFEQGAYQKSLTAEYSTRAFGPGAAPYYNLRYRNRWEGLSIFGLDKMWWSLELLHHKLWLDNRPPEVDEFRMTFGFNLIPFSLGGAINEWLNVYGGTGPIVVHPVNTVNGLTLPNEPIMWPTDHRYTLVGWGLQLGLEAHYPLWRNVFLNADTRLSYSYSSVPLVGGRAKTHQASWHFHGGLGYRW